MQKPYRILMFAEEIKHISTLIDEEWEIVASGEIENSLKSAGRQYFKIPTADGCPRLLSAFHVPNPKMLSALMIGQFEDEQIEAHDCGIKPFDILFIGEFSQKPAHIWEVYLMTALKNSSRVKVVTDVDDLVDAVSNIKFRIDEDNKRLAFKAWQKLHYMTLNPTGLLHAELFNT